MIPALILKLNVMIIKDSVEYYDYNSGEYKSGYLDLFPGASGILYDEDTGEEFDIQME